MISTQTLAALAARSLVVTALACGTCGGTARGDDQAAWSLGAVASREGNSREASQPRYLAEEQSVPTPLLQNAMNRAHLGDLKDKYGIAFYGFIEGSYTYNFFGARLPNAGRLFDFENAEPRMNQLDLQVERLLETKDINKAAKEGRWDFGGKIEVIYGSDAGFIHANGLGTYYDSPRDPINQLDLPQAYLDIVVPIGTGLDVRVGKFITLLGYEYTNPTLNSLFSHSFLFNVAVPATQTGVLATYALNEKLSVQGGVTRGWDQATNDNNGAMDFLGGVQYTLTDACKLGVYLSTGPQRRHNNHDYLSMVDTQLSITPEKSPWNFAVNADYAYDVHAAPSGGSAHWYGVAGYVGYKITDLVTVNGRAEWFRDEQGTRIGGPAGNYYEATVGLSIRPFPQNEWAAGLSIRPEIRHDWTGRGFFNGGSKTDQTTAAVDVILAF
jgi:hypothetical protein